MNKMGQTQLTEEYQDTEFYDRIADDIKQVHIQFISEAGHGKSSSLKTILQHCQNKHPDVMFKIFDQSLAWWHNAPTRYRQSITIEAINKGKISNIADCVYEIGSLPYEAKRWFVANIIREDYQERFSLEKANHGTLKKLPFFVYVIEEADMFFGSYSLRGKDAITEVFRSFVSIGRNLRMRGILVATAEIGEISPSFRRRSRKIYGRLTSDGDINKVKKRYKELAKYLETIPPYHFVYISDKPYGPIRIPDTVNHTPIDPFSLLKEEVQPIVESKPSPWMTLFVWGVIGLLVLVAILSSL